MFSKPALTRCAQHAFRNPALQAARRRAHAAASGSALFGTSDVAGLKVASRDNHGPTTNLAIVAKAGTRYEPGPGLSAGLAEFAFKNTYKRSALRIQRESELLGGELKAYFNREAVVIEARFLRADLPYFVELLGELVAETRYSTFEFKEDVQRVLPMKMAKHATSPAALATDAAHAVAFHAGLGNPIYPSLAAPVGPYLDEHSISAFSDNVYTKANLSLVADGANPEILSQWSEKYFTELPASSETYKPPPASKYYGGEDRIPHALGNSMVLAFNSDVSKPEFDVLAALLGGRSSISRSPGFTHLSKMGLTQHAVATNIKYSDVGLFTIELGGAAPSVRLAAEGAVKALQGVAGGVSKEDLTKAVAKAKLEAFEASQESRSSMLASGLSAIDGKVFDVTAIGKGLDDVSADNVQAAAKSLIGSKASVAAVGDLFVLPYAADIGLSV